MSFDVGEGVTSMMVDIANITNDIPVSVIELYDPSGDVVVTDSDLDFRRLSSWSLYPHGTTTKLPYPLSPETPAPLSPGEWTVLFGLYTLDGLPVRQADVDIEMHIITKADPELTQGQLNVHVIYVDGIEEDEALMDGIGEAITQWQRYAQETHSLKVAVRTSVADATLARPFSGNSAYAELSVQALPYELTLLVGEAFDNANLYGEAGGIPGSLAPTARTGIGIAARNIAGVDGELNAEEVQTLSQVFGHEIGHYLGLQHVVGGSYDVYDPLTDTAECNSESDCEATLASNLMYPFALGVQQRGLTPQQLVVSQRAVAVD